MSRLIDRAARWSEATIRAQVAEEIAKAIEQSAPEPAARCSGQFCPHCARCDQAQADAATARRIGGSR